MISPRTRRTRLALAGGRDDGGTAARAFADSGDAPGTLPCCPCGHGTFGVLLPSYGCDATALLRSDALDRCPSAAVDLFPEVRSLRTGRSTLRCRPRECVARVGEDFLGALRGGGGETYSAPFAFLSLSYIHLEFGRAQSFFSDRGTSEKTLAPPIRGRIRTRPRGIATILFFFSWGRGGTREEARAREGIWVGAAPSDSAPRRTSRRDIRRSSSFTFPVTKTKRFDIQKIFASNRLR